MSLSVHRKDASNRVFQASWCSLGTYLSICIIRPISNFLWSSLIFLKYPALCSKIHLLLKGSRSLSTSIRLQCVATPVQSMSIPASMTVLVKPILPPQEGKARCRSPTTPSPHTTPILTFLMIVFVIPVLSCSISLLFQGCQQAQVAVQARMISSGPKRNFRTFSYQFSVGVEPDIKLIVEQQCMKHREMWPRIDEINDDCMVVVYIQTKLQNKQRMSTFKSKAQLLKAHLSEEQQAEQQQIQIVKECKQTTAKQELSLQQPIIIERKTIVKSESQNFKKSVKESQTYVRKKVEPWAPINVPVREKKMDLENVSMNAPPVQGNKEIEIQIQKDDKNKDCLKKLFKKVRKLQDDLKQSEKERVRLNLELQNYKNRSKICTDHEKIIAKLQAENYKLAVDLDMLKRLIKEREDQIQRLNLRAPKEIIKEVIVEKPVEVIVQVPKLIPGPQRIVEKIVEIPKYIEVEKKVMVDVIKEVPKEVIRTITVEVPTIVEKPVYIDKPVYIESPPIEREKIVEVPVRVDVPYEVPVEYPVYIDKPVVEEEWLVKIRELEESLEYAMRDNAFLASENNNLRVKVSQLAENLEVMRRHNQEKNREVEILLQNSIDYMPFSPNQQDYSMGSVKYSISSNPHPRII